MKGRAKRARTAALGLASAALCSCLTGSADFSKEKAAIESATGLTLAAGSSVGIGGATFSLARWLGVGKSEADDVMQHLEGAEVAVFQVRGGDARRAVDAVPSPPGWTCLVRARQRNSNARILLEESSAKLSHLLVATSEGNELVLVRVHGAFEAIVAQALSRRSRLPSSTRERPAADARTEGEGEGEGD